LFSLLLVVRDAVPRDCLVQLLRALEQDPHVDPWVQALGDLLRRGPGAARCSPPPTPLSSACRQQLRCLCRRIAQNKPEEQRKLKWCADSLPRGGKRKKVLEDSLELDEEREGKKSLLEEVVFDPPGPQECGDVAGVGEEVPKEPSGDTSAQSVNGAGPDGSQQDVLGEHGKISQTELAAEDCVSLQHSELTVRPELRILHNCSPGQLEGLCSFLQLSTCPEPVLVRFCRWLLALTPDLSYTSAAVLAEQLFLRRVLSLTQAPSRHLMAALTSFCSKYSQPFCRVLVAAVLRQPGEGAEQIKLVCELVEECLEPHCMQLVLSQVLEVPLSEKLLLVLQAVLGQQELLPPELLNLLVKTLCQQAPTLAASRSYARLVTAVLSVCQSEVS
ncbi:Fanconi anemia group E protein, partial [Acanthisitta chloris]